MPSGSIVEALREALSSRQDIALAVLFGSHARQTDHAGSDVDVAVLPQTQWPLAAELELQAELEARLRRPVDLVRVEDAGPLLAWEIARDGLFVVGDERRFARFRAEAALAHAELAPMAEAAARHYIRRIAEDGMRHD
jgi:predicted nucleotidyltransferase